MGCPNRIRSQARYTWPGIGIRWSHVALHFHLRSDRKGSARETRPRSGQLFANTDHGWPCSSTTNLLRPCVSVLSGRHPARCVSCRLKDIGSFTYVPGSFMSWLSRIAEHVIVDEARSQARQKRRAAEVVRFRSAGNPGGPEPVDSETPSRILMQKKSPRTCWGD